MSSYKFFPIEAKITHPLRLL